MKTRVAKVPMAKTIISSSDVKTVSAAELKNGPGPAAMALAEDFTYDPTIYDVAVLDSIKNWEREQVGIPPYWKPKTVGPICLGRVLSLDEDNTVPPYIKRYTLEAVLPIQCERGSTMTNSVIPVTIQKGEYFTVGMYAGLPLERFFDIVVAFRTINKRKLPPNEQSDNKPRDLWEWAVMVHPDDKAKLAARREEDIQRLIRARNMGMYSRTIDTTAEPAETVNG